jgi:hypothetical protein
MIVMDSGYSGTPQLKKLGIAANTRLDVVGAPIAWVFETEPDALRTPIGAVDVVLAFVTTAAELRTAVAQLADRIRPAGAMWIAWPRKAAGHVSEVTENLIRDVVLPLDLVDVKVAAIDTDWSGLKVVWRKEAR